MGRYIDQDDIENVFGTANVSQWSNLDSTSRATTADTSRITTAIENAEDEIDDLFRDGRYTIPFVATGSSLPKKLIDWCAKLAGVWLYENRGSSSSAQDADGDRIRFHKKTVYDDVALYQAGQAKLAAQLVSRGGSCPEAVR